jgi:hypothetical protein
VIGAWFRKHKCQCSGIDNAGDAASLQCLCAYRLGFLDILKRCRSHAALHIRGGRIRTSGAARFRSGNGPQVQNDRGLQQVAVSSCAWPFSLCERPVQLRHSFAGKPDAGRSLAPAAYIFHTENKPHTLRKRMKKRESAWSWKQRSVR